MNKDEVQGKARNLKGRVKEAAGALTGNKQLESDGANDRASGAAQDTVGKARRKVGEALENLGKNLKK
jgi:uncharacterized protein YjbJ (UPF0337 family)